CYVLNAEAEAVQIILTGIDNDIYSTVDACLNACEMWKAIERLKQGESINVQDLKTILFWEFRKFTSQDEPSMVAEDEEMSKDKEIDKLMALISLSFKKIYKPTNNNLELHPTLVVQIRIILQGLTEVLGMKIKGKSKECAKQADWKDDTDDETDDQELKAHYMYMAKVQEVSPDAVDFGPIFDTEPEQKNDDDVDLAKERELLASLIEKLKCEIDESKNRSRGTELYSITLQNTNSPNPICLVAKATSSQAWLWHRRLSHLNFDTINLLSKNDIVVGLPKVKFVKDHLCSSCELGKAKRTSFHTKLTPSSKDGYNFYTWTYVVPCGSKDETPEVLIDFLRLVQRGLQAQVGVVRTDKGTEFLNQTLHAYFAAEGIQHQTSVARTPIQNGVVERHNRTLVEAARTLLSAAKFPLSFWAEAIATACFTQNRSLVIPRHEKTPYHIINDRKPSDPTPECQTMVLDQNSSDPAPECQTMALDQISSDLAPE
nr:hypothetical protein [Tanacetum cinerariifolium]